MRLKLLGWAFSHTARSRPRAPSYPGWSAHYDGNRPASQDAKEQIRRALEGSVGEYDIDAIFDEVFDYDDGYDEETNACCLNSAGYYDTTSDPEEFWQIAFNHQLPDN